MHLNKSREKYIILFSILLVILFSINVKISILGIAIIALVVFIIKPLWWIYFTLTYITFEVVIQNFTPTSMIGLLRYGIEGVSYLILIISIFKAILRKREIKIATYDYLIIIFIIMSLIGAAINEVNMSIFILGLRWILRYVVIYYIFKFNNFSEHQLKKVVKHFYFLILIQLLIGLLQFVFREQFDAILSPKVIELEFHTIKSIQLDSRYAIYSTFGRYGEYAYFMTLAIFFLFTKYVFKPNKKNFLLILISLIVIILTYARQALLAVIVSIIMYIYFDNHKKSIKKRYVTTFILVGLVSTGIYFGYNEFQKGKGILNENISQRYLSVFSFDFIKNDYLGQGRTYFLTTVNKKILKSKPLIGFGVGMYGTEPAIKYDQSVYDELGVPTKFSMDVYLTSILGQSGLIGVCILFGIYYAFYRKSTKIKRTDNEFMDFIALFLKLTIIGISIESFFGSNLSDRYQAYYVWMFFGIFDTLSNNRKGIKEYS